MTNARTVSAAFDHAEDGRPASLRPWRFPAFGARADGRCYPRLLPPHRRGSGPGLVPSIRGIRVDGDGSVDRLAARLAASIQPIPRRDRVADAGERPPHSRRMEGICFEQRGRLSLLRHRGLRLNASDTAIVNELAPESGTRSALGRPLSARLTVTERRLDLEIHADGAVPVAPGAARRSTC